MDIASLIGPTTSAAVDPTVASPAAPTAPGEAFADVLTEAMVDGVPPIGDVPNLDVTGGTTMVIPESVVEVQIVPEAILPDCPVAPPVEPRRIGPCKGLQLPKTPPEPPPPDGKLATISRKEAATEAPNAPAQEPDQPEETEDVFVVDAPAAQAAPACVPAVIASHTTNLPTPAAQKFSDMGEAKVNVSATAGAAKTTSIVDPAPIADAQSPAKLPVLESAPDLGIVPQVSVAPVVEAATPVPPVSVDSIKNSPPLNVIDVKVASEAKDAPAKVTSDLRVATKVAESAMPSSAPETKEPSVAKDAKVGATAQIDVPLTKKNGAGNDEAPSDDAPKDNLLQQVGPTRTQTAATERPDAGADRPTVDRHLVVRQVADRIENLVASRPRDGVTIHLEPRDLGTVTLVVKGLSSALDVQMFASDDRVRESLNSSRPELAQALAPRHIEIRELRVSTAPTPAGSSSGAGSTPDDRPRQQAPSQPPSGRGFTTSSRTEKATSTSRAARSGRGVDLLV